MTVHLVSLVVDAIHPADLAGFWASALRWNARASGDLVELLPTDSTSFRLTFRPGARPKTAQNRIHLDLTTTSLDDRDSTVTGLLAAGATRIDIGQGPDEPHVVLADPEGNEFCVIEPTNRFLAGCPRLGAVNCDGTRALGHFVSRAIGWPLVWDEHEETAVQAPDHTGPKITWSGPPLMPRHPPERFHFHVAPGAGTDTDAALNHLLDLGATPVTATTSCPGASTLADVDGNRICLVPR